MQIRRWRKVAVWALLTTVAIFWASWRVGQRPYISPGTHQNYRMDSTPGAMLEFLVILILGFAGMMTLAKVPRSGRAFAGIASSYMAALVLVSLFTPKTIVSVGDSYCWDLWCVGIQNVSATAQGQSVLYTADMALFVDSTNPQVLRADPSGKQFFYVMDEQGRRFPIVPTSPVAGDVIVKPGEYVKSAWTFIAPANARSLYLTGDVGAPPWVRLYFGSDLNPFHRRTLLRVV